jgi:hypothetical protein
MLNYNPDWAKNSQKSPLTPLTSPFCKGGSRGFWGKKNLDKSKKLIKVFGKKGDLYFRIISRLVVVN